MALDCSSLKGVVFFIWSFFFLVYVFLKLSKDSIGLYSFLSIQHTSKKCFGRVGTPCPSLGPVTLHTSSLHFPTRCQMDQGRMRLWCTWVVCPFESEVLQPTCQKCWFTITFVKEDHFWHGCHTSTNGLLFKHGALLHSYSSWAAQGLWSRFSFCSPLWGTCIQHLPLLAVCKHEKKT